MKKIVILLSLFFLVSCASNPSIITNVEECLIYQQYGANPSNSLIAAKIPDPCAAKRILTVAAKLPAIEWEKEYTQEFDKWASNLENLVAGGIKYYELQDLILLEVTKMNKKIGQALFITSGLFVFTERGWLMDKDTELILGLIQHLREQVAAMEVLYAEVS